MKPQIPITCKHLVTAGLGLKQVTSVEIKEITIEPGQEGGLHLHPCPVTGNMVRGTAVMQIKDQAEQVLKLVMHFTSPETYIFTI